MTRSTRIFRIYRWAVVFAAFVVFIYNANDLTPSNSANILLAVIALMVIHTLGIALPAGISLNFDFVVYAVTLFSTGPMVLGWSAIIANIFFLFLDEFRGRRKLSFEHALFNGAQFAISGFLAGWMYVGMGGQFNVDPLLGNKLGVVLYTIFTFFLVNSALVYTSFHLDPQINISNREFRFYLYTDVFIYLLTSFTALMILHYYPGSSSLSQKIEYLILFPFFLTPIIALHLGVRLYKQTHDLHQMFEIIRILNAPKELPDALHEIMTLVKPMVNFDQCCVWEADPSNGTISRLLAHYPESEMPPSPTISQGGGLRGQVVRSGRMLRITDLRSATHRSSHEPDEGSMIIIPLIYENDVVGLIDYYKKHTHFYDRRNLPTMQAIADEIAITVAKDRLFREVQRAAVTDKLTGLHNRLYFEDRITYDINRGQRYGQMVSLLFMDIDHFKMCNDTYGHAAGDSLLRQLAEILRTSVRKTDLVSRYGGEELVIILPNTAKEQAAILAEKIRQRISTYEFSHEDIRISTTISIGVAAYPADASDAAGLVQKADAAMYQAKQKGRNRVSISGMEIPELTKK